MKNKILLGIFLVFCINIAIADVGDGWVSPSAKTVDVDDSFTVSVVADPRPSGAYTADVTLSYNPTYLEVTSVSHNIPAGWTVSGPTYDNTNGKVELVSTGWSPITSQTTLLTVTFKAKSATTSTSLTLTKLEMLYQGADVITSESGGTVTISAPPACTDDPACAGKADNDFICDGTSRYRCEADSNGCLKKISRLCTRGKICDSTASGFCGCPADKELCSGSCVDIQTDADNCGGCGTACSDIDHATDSCSGGACVCETSYSWSSSTKTCTISCTPVCTGKECGADGCGGSCGTCDTGEVCKSGACVEHVEKKYLFTDLKYAKQALSGTQANHLWNATTDYVGETGINEATFKIHYAGYLSGTLEQCNYDGTNPSRDSGNLKYLAYYTDGTYDVKTFSPSGMNTATKESEYTLDVDESKTIDYFQIRLSIWCAAESFTLLGGNVTFEAETTGCTSNADCTNADKSVCDLSSGECVECTSNTHCSSTTPLCSADNQCVWGCLTDAHCSGNTPVCDTTNNRCIACSTSTSTHWCTKEGSFELKGGGGSEVCYTCYLGINKNTARATLLRNLGAIAKSTVNSNCGGDSQAPCTEYYSVTTCDFGYKNNGGTCE